MFNLLGGVMKGGSKSNKCISKSKDLELDKTVATAMLSFPDSVIAVVFNGQSLAL